MGTQGLRVRLVRGQDLALAHIRRWWCWVSVCSHANTRQLGRIEAPGELSCVAVLFDFLFLSHSVQRLWKTVWHESQKFSIHMPYGPAHFTPRHIPERISGAWTPGDSYKNVHSSSIHNGKDLETAQMPVSTGIWMNTLRCGHTMEY